MSVYKPTWWDRLLTGFAPRWGMRRIQSKAALQSMLRSFDASSTSRRTSGWRPSATDADSANERHLPRLRELARDLKRNNGWARRGVQAIGNSTVGWGIQAKPDAKSKHIRKSAGEIWKAWAESPLCDYHGRMPFTGLQRLVMDTVVESGEALVVRVGARDDDPIAVPVRLMVLEPDLLYAGRDRPAAKGQNAISQGIEYDQYGRRVAYHMYEGHPGGNTARSVSSTRYPADRVLHIYRVERPGQSRGVPWLASAIARLNDLDDYEDAVLMQQKIAACFGAFVRDLDGLGTNIAAKDSSNNNLEVIEPGMIQYLPQGKDISFATPPTPPQGTFETAVLRRIAVSLGVTYEQLTGDYSKVNFSSARVGRLEHWASVYDWRWNMLIPQLCDGVWRWVMEEAAARHGWRAVPAARWSPPPPPMLEPDKEGLAYQRQIRAGIKTWPQVIRELGFDPDHHREEIAEHNKKLDELGIVLDSDPRRTSTSGGAQPAPGGDAEASTEGDNPGDTEGEGPDEE